MSNWLKWLNITKENFARGLSASDCLNYNPHDAVGRTQLLLFAGKDQVITLLFLITVMLITAINGQKQGGQGKSSFI